MGMLLYILLTGEGLNGFKWVGGGGRMGEFLVFFWGKKLPSHQLTPETSGNSGKTDPVLGKNDG